MKMPVRCLPWVLAMLACGHASAQPTLYRCTLDGHTSMSDRPCPGAAAASQTLVGVARATGSNALSAARPANYLDYLSPTCAGLNEALRTGTSRGLGTRAMLDLQNAYRDRCLDEDMAARRRLRDDMVKRREASNNEAAAEKRERERLVQSREQCDEMRRIVQVRRTKLDAMSTGERADFERFEANWKSRCAPA